MDTRSCGYAIEFKGDDCGHCGNQYQEWDFLGSLRDQLSLLSEVPFMNSEFEKESITGVQSLIRGEWIAVARSRNNDEETRVKLAKKAFHTVDVEITKTIGLDRGRPDGSQECYRSQDAFRILMKHRLANQFMRRMFTSNQS